MIDNLSILLSHGLLALALWFLSNRPDLDSEPPPPPDDESEGFARKRPGNPAKRQAAADA